MSVNKANAGQPDPYKRYTTKESGVTYRVRADGSRRYFVYAQGKQIPVEGGFQEAKDLKAELRGKTKRGHTVAPRNVKVSNVAEEWYASKTKLRARTRDGYRHTLDAWVIPTLGHRRIAEITVDDIAALVLKIENSKTAREKKPSASTVVNHLKPLSGIFKYAQRKGYVETNPVALLLPEERPQMESRELRILEPAEIAKLLEASRKLAERKVAHYDYTPILELAIFTGLRIGELLGLQWHDVDFEKRVLHVRRSVNPRGEVGEPKTKNSRRRIPFDDDVAAILLKVRNTTAHKAPGDFVFSANEPRTGGSDSRSHPLSQRNVTSRGFEPAVKSAKLNVGEKPKLRFHDLRHCFASMMIAEEISATDLAAIMGHAHSGITEKIYVHQFDEVRTAHRLRAASGSAFAKIAAVAS